MKNLPPKEDVLRWVAKFATKREDTLANTSDPVMRHRIIARDSMRRLQARRLKLGLCTRCGSKPDRPGFRWCLRCSQKNEEKRKRRARLNDHTSTTRDSHALGPDVHCSTATKAEEAPLAESQKRQEPRTNAENSSVPT